MASQARVRLAYVFFQQHSTPGIVFTREELMAATGWRESSVDTYYSKHWREVLERLSNGQYRVRPEFQQLSLEEFLNIARQKRHLFTSYQRTKFAEIVTYEFLLPLTREDLLRKSLDALFYTDTIQRRIEEIDKAEMERSIPRVTGEHKIAYAERVCQVIGEKFGGYSISHVSGRYRAGNLTSREEASRMLRADERYIIDETTASVRFIIPLQASKLTQEVGFAQVAPHPEEPELALRAEIALVHWLFFTFFVEAVVRIVAGEDEIWMVEEAPGTRNLYAWERMELS